MLDEVFIWTLLTVILDVDPDNFDNHFLTLSAFLDIEFLLGASARNLDRSTVAGGLTLT